MSHAPAPPRSADEQTRLDATLTELFETSIRFNQVLGVRVRQLRPQAQFVFEMRAELVGHFLSGRLHGGVIAAVLDALGASR